jgi:hypothetical protein
MDEVNQKKHERAHARRVPHFRFPDSSVSNFEVTKCFFSIFDVHQRNDWIDGCRLRVIEELP